MEKFSLNSKELMPSAIIGAFETDEEEVAVAVAVAREVAEAGAVSEPALSFRWPMAGYRGNELIRDQQRLKEKVKTVPKAAEKGEEWKVPGIVFWKKRN